MKKRAIVFAVMFMCISVISACSGGNSKTTDNNSAGTTMEKDVKVENESDVAKQASQTETAENNELNASEEDAVYNIGDSITLKDWEISVTSVQIVDSIAADYGQFSPNEEGNKYIQVFVTVNNNGKQADSFLPSFGMGDDVTAKVLYGDGYEFSASNLLGYSNEMHDSSINPLSSKSGEIAFDVPESVATSTDELIIEFISGNDSVKFKIR